LNVHFEKFEIPEIVGRLMPENIASIKVLEKLGMIYRETRNLNEVDWLILSMKNSE
jgi:RimJ/RimL family protein N-acetyltransferase